MIIVLHEQGTIWKILSQLFFSSIERRRKPIIFTCMQISSAIGGPKSSNRMSGKMYIPIIHELVCVFLDVPGAKNRMTATPSFTTGDVSIFRQALYKDGAAKITKDLRLHGLLPESVEFLSPSQTGGFSGGFSGHQGAVRSVANQMKEKTAEMPTLMAVASKLGSRGNQGALKAIILRTGIALEEAAGEKGRRANDNRRIGTRDCATENCKNTIHHTDGLCNRCHDLVPTKLKAEFCTGVGGRVCGREMIHRGNQCRKCYDHPEAKKTRETKKAEKPKCRIDGCGVNEFRSYGLCDKHYRKRNKDAKAEMKVATDSNFCN
jgi:hypothetical protein